MTSHSPEGPNHDDPLAVPTYLIGAVGTVILVATVILVQTLVYDAREEVQAEQNARDFLEIAGVRAFQTEQLEAYRWTYPDLDLVGIPVELGVEQVLKVYGKGSGK